MKLFLLALSLLSACNSSTPQNISTPANPIIINSMHGLPPQHHKTGYIRNPKSKYGRIFWEPNSIKKMIADNTVPDSWDWRTQGKKTPILDQGNCGSCWAFGSIQTEIASALIFGNQILALSPQEIVSYDTNNDGCQGGNYAKEFMQKYGAVLESQCPYTGSDRKCQPDPTKLIPAFKPASVVFIGDPDGSPTFDQVAAYIYQYGYVGVSAGADNDWESAGAVLTQCNGTAVNHEIAAFAYNRTGQWIKIQNSWGKDFGDPADPGTMQLPWGCDNMAADAGAIVPTSAPCQPPTIDLEKELSAYNGQPITVAVQEQTGVTYTWTMGATTLGTGAEITFTPTAPGDLMVTAVNSCGTAREEAILNIW